MRKYGHEIAKPIFFVHKPDFEGFTRPFHGVFIGFLLFWHGIFMVSLFSEVPQCQNVRPQFLKHGISLGGWTLIG